MIVEILTTDDTTYRHRPTQSPLLPNNADPRHVTQALYADIRRGSAIDVEWDESDDSDSFIDTKTTRRGVVVIPVETVIVVRVVTEMDVA